LNTLLNYFRIDKSKLDFDEENNEFLEWDKNIFIFLWRKIF
jgi:hypothetical protein